MKCSHETCNNQPLPKLSLCKRHEAIRRRLYCDCGRVAYFFNTRECTNCRKERISKQDTSVCASRHCNRRVFRNLLCLECYGNRWGERLPKIEEPRCVECKERNIVARATYLGQYCDRHFKKKLDNGLLDLNTTIASLISTNIILTTTNDCIITNCFLKRHSRSMCEYHLNLWILEDLDYEEAEYKVPERIRTLLWDVVHFANMENKLSFDRFWQIFYKGSKESAALRQWSRIRNYLDQHKIPYKETLDKTGRVALYFDYSPHFLEEMFK